MKKLLPWLMVAAMVVVTFGTIYGTVQQAQRSGANAPQIQLAEDAATALDQGAQPSAVAAGRVDAGRSLAPFIIVYSKAGQAVAGSGYLDGKLPLVPIGVLQASVGQTYHTVTWQPRNDVRLATVTVTARHYYVLSARSLQEVEKNETKTTQIAILGCLVVLVLLAMMFVTMLE